MLTDLVVNPTEVTADLAVDAARAAEDAGFSGVWTYDHLSGSVLERRSVLEPWGLLGAMAVATRTVTVGPLVANATVRHPAYLASAAATLQQLSDGRAILGLGAGAGPGSPFATEVTMIGSTPRGAAERRSMVAESIEVIRTLWRGEGEYEGVHYRLDGAHGLATPATLPPIIVGANGPKMCELAGRLADGVNIHWFEPRLAELLSVARDAAGDRPFTATVEAPLEDEWLDDSHPSRSGLLDGGVDRLMVAWRAEHGLDAIARAGRLLSSAAG